jgi:hypothetical protein
MDLFNAERLDGSLGHFAKVHKISVKLHKSFFLHHFFIFSREQELTDPRTIYDAGTVFYKTFFQQPYRFAVHTFHN